MTHLAHPSRRKKMYFQLALDTTAACHVRIIMVGSSGEPLPFCALAAVVTIQKALVTSEGLLLLAPVDDISPFSRPVCRKQVSVQWGTYPVMVRMRWSSTLLSNCMLGLTQRW